MFKKHRTREGVEGQLTKSRGAVVGIPDWSSTKLRDSGGVDKGKANSRHSGLKMKTENKRQTRLADIKKVAKKEAVRATREDATRSKLSSNNSS